MWAIGSVTGPIIGGAFAQHGIFKHFYSPRNDTDWSLVTWRWIFWINMPIVGIGYILVTLFLKLQHTKAAPFREQLKRVDVFGTLLFVTSTTSILIPISWVGHQIQIILSYADDRRVG